ncbi:MAG: hypothetical protein R3B09_16630 [Nannocystaceae bacterium]
MTQKNLMDALRRAHLEALRVDLAEDIHPAYVNLLFSEGSVAAEDVLHHLWPADPEAQRVALEGHHALLWARAPEALLQALLRLSPGLRVEQCALLLGRVEASRDAVMPLVTKALAAASEPLARAQALLALARAGEGGRVDEVMPLLSKFKISDVARVLREYGSIFCEGHRAALHRQAFVSSDRGWSSTALVELARVAPADEARSHALAYLDRCRIGRVVTEPALLAGLALVIPWEELRPWVDPHLECAREGWVAVNTVSAWARLAAPDQLDKMIPMIVDSRTYPWDQVALFAELSRHHPTRGEELLQRARCGLAPLIGAERHVATTHQVHTLFAVSMACDEEEREVLQRDALVCLERDLSDYLEGESIVPYRWKNFGDALVPTLRERAIEIVCRFDDRRTCWRAIGELVGRFPREMHRHALRVLHRIADGPNDEVIDEVRGILEGEVKPDDRLPALAEREACVEERGNDEAAEGSLSEYVELIAGRVARIHRNLTADSDYVLSLTVDALTPEDNLSALNEARASAGPWALLDPEVSEGRRLRAVALAMLIGRAHQRGCSGLEPALADALAVVAEVDWIAWRIEAMVPALVAVCPPGDPAWCARLAAVFDGPAGAGEFWYTVRTFVPALRRALGSAVIDELKSRLTMGLAVPKSLAIAAARRGD